MELWGWLANNWIQSFKRRWRHRQPCGSRPFHCVRKPRPGGLPICLPSPPATGKSGRNFFIDDKAWPGCWTPGRTLTKQPITDEERIVCQIRHSSPEQRLLCYERSTGVKVEGLRRDIAQFFSLPIPRDVGKRSKSFKTTISSRLWNPARTGNSQFGSIWIQPAFGPWQISGASFRCGQPPGQGCCSTVAASSL